MSMTMVIVPPTGVPMVVPIGKAIFPKLFNFKKMLEHYDDKAYNDSIKNLRKPKIYLDELFDVPQDSFYLDINKGMTNERRVFTNGTIIFRYLLKYNEYLVFPPY